MKQQESLDPRKNGLLLGRLVREKREAAGISQAELARQLGMTESYVSRLERGEFRRPQPQVLMAIAERFGIDINDLYAVTGCLLSTKLPSFSAYLHAVHPDWPVSVTDELVDYYEFVKQRHKLR